MKNVKARSRTTVEKKKKLKSTGKGTKRKGKNKRTEKIPLRVSLGVSRQTGKDVRGLTEHDSDFVKKFLKKPNAMDVIREIADEQGIEMSEHGIQNAASKSLSNPAVQSAITVALDAAGATDEKVATVLAEGLDAWDVRAALDNGIPSEHAKKTAPDFASRRGYAEVILKAKGHLKDNAVGAKIINYVSFKGGDDGNIKQVKATEVKE